MNSDFPSERAARKHLILTLVAAALIYAGAYAMARFASGPTLAFVVCSPLLAAYLAWFLIHRGSSGLFFLKRTALREHDGKGHFFGDLPIRIEESDGRCRIAVRDLFEALGERLDAQTLRRLQLNWGEGALCRDEAGDWWFEEAAALQWLGDRSEGLNRTAQRLRRWLEREALAALHRKMELRGRAVVAQAPPSRQP